MQTLFEWDRDKAAANLRKHRVSFDEAQTVFTDDFSITIPDPDHSDIEDRLIIIGMSSDHWLLVVIYAERDRKIRLISARKATRQEREKYENQELASFG
jgi:uncharacterized DUF497 family protein